MRGAAVALAALALAGCRTVVWYGHDPERVHRVEVVERLGRQRVVVDGVAGPAYDGVGVAGLAIDARGRAVYAARRGGAWRVVRDGVEGEAWNGVAELALSRGGEHLAYAGLRDAVWRVVVDGVPGPAFDGIFAGSLRIAPNGAVVYAADRGGRRHGVRGDVVGLPSDGVAEVVLSEDGAHAGWLERRGGEVRAVVDGVAGPAWEDARDLALARDGAPAYAARRGDAWWAVVGGRARGPHLEVRTLRVSPAGVAVYVARGEEGERVVAGERTSSAFHAVLEVVTDGGERVAWIARDGTACVAVIDGTARGPWDAAGGLSLGPGGRWALVAAGVEGTRVVHDRGEEVVGAALADTLVFAANGSWAVVAGDRTSGEMFVAVEGGRRVPVDAEEFAAAALRARENGQALPALLRAWTAAQAARASQSRMAKRLSPPSGPR